jgi:hypothetical protein
MCRSRLFHWRQVGTLPIAAAVENRGPALIIGIVFHRFRLIVRRTVIHGIGHGHGVPYGTDKLGIVVPLMMAIATSVVVGALASGR